MYHEIKKITSKKPERALAVDFEDFLKQHEAIPLLICVAGGSVLNEVLPVLNPHLLNQYSTVSVLDERYTDEEAGQNQFHFIKTPWFKTAVAQGAHTLAVPNGTVVSALEAARSFETQFLSWHRYALGGKVVVLGGVGADGHIAGLFPHSDDECKGFCTNHLVEAYDFDNAGEYKHRITPTFTWWRSFDPVTFIYMSGEEKRSALDAILSSEGEYNDTPARILRTLSECTIYTDIE